MVQTKRWFMQLASRPAYTWFILSSKHHIVPKGSALGQWACNAGLPNYTYADGALASSTHCTLKLKQVHGIHAWLLVMYVQLQKAPLHHLHPQYLLTHLPTYTNAHICPAIYPGTDARTPFKISQARLRCICTSTTTYKYACARVRFRLRVLFLSFVFRRRVASMQACIHASVAETFQRQLARYYLSS